MEGKTPRWTLGELAQMVGGSLEGPADFPIAGPAPFDSDDPLSITFAENERYLAEVEKCGVGAVLLAKDLRLTKKPAIRVDRPREVFFMLLKMSERPTTQAPGVHASAIVHGHVAASASIGPYVVIEEGAEVGDEAMILPFTYVGPGCRVGDNTTLHARVTLVQDVFVGERCIVHSGVVLGADGFGFIWDGQRRLKVPQVGGVVIGDDVEIGANATVDRSTCGDTLIGDGVKLDNLVHIAHNCRVGEHTVLAALCGVAGTVNIGKRCVFGGMTGFKDHISIGDDVHVGGMSGLEKDVPVAGAYLGNPALPIAEGIRVIKSFEKLPAILSRLRKLEKKVGD